MESEKKMKDISVYIVEDYKLTRAAYIHYLSTVEGIEVLKAFETAEECLQSMQEQPADIVLMDLGLPYMNGIEATKIIHKNFPKTKVIVLTSHDRNEEIYASLASGANAYTLKDINLDELVNVIRSVSKGSVWIDSRIAQMALAAFPKPQSTESFDKLYNNSALNVELTERELEVLRLIVEGKSNIEIAKELFVSQHTAKSHVCKILSKLSVSDRVQAAVKAVKYNLF